VIAEAQNYKKRATADSTKTLSSIEEMLPFTFRNR
jgi:hypothetical protein